MVAVIVFGALIIVGSERQKRELARIRKVEEQWAEQDLRIKRGKLARETKIEESVTWLSMSASKALSAPVVLAAKEVLTNPDALAFVVRKAGADSSLPFCPRTTFADWRRNANPARLLA